MTLAEKFVRGIVDSVFAAAKSTIQTLTSPPGRAPDPRLLELSDWYHTLSPGDQTHVTRVAAFSADRAVFGMLAAFDGASRILPVSDADAVRVQLMTAEGPVLLPTKADPLHDLYRGLVDPMGELRPGEG
jgi:hypothetical protein